MKQLRVQAFKLSSNCFYKAPICDDLETRKGQQSKILSKFLLEWKSISIFVYCGWHAVVGE